MEIKWVGNEFSLTAMEPLNVCQLLFTIVNGLSMERTEISQVEDE